MVKNPLASAGDTGDIPESGCLDPWIGKIPWKRKQQGTPVFLPGESQGRGSPVGRHLWGRTESDTTEVT